jgi:phosphatidylinositol transfer protein SFH5
MLPEIIAQCQGTNTLWGVPLNAANPNDAPTKIILKKFLKARKGNLKRARTMLKDTIVWYRDMKSRTGLDTARFTPAFYDLAYVTAHPTLDHGRIVVIWNLWKNVTDHAAVFNQEDDM